MYSLGTNIQNGCKLQLTCEKPLWLPLSNLLLVIFYELLQFLRIHLLLPLLDCIYYAKFHVWSWVLLISYI